MTENTRPDIKPEWSLVEKILQIVSVLVLAATAIQLIMAWSTLPQTIPTHFNAAGSPDGWGGKTTLLMLPIFEAAMYIMLTVIERFPKIYNFPVEITEKNALLEYQTARETLVCIKSEMLLIFGYLQWVIVEGAKTASFSLGLWFVPVFLVIITLTLVYYIARMKRHGTGD